MNLKKELINRVKKVSGAKTYSKLVHKIKKFAGLETEKIDVDALINTFAEKFEGNHFIERTGNEGEELKNIYYNLDDKQQKKFREELKEIVGDGINVKSNKYGGVALGTLSEYRHVKSLPGSDKLKESTKVWAAYKFNNEKRVDYTPIAEKIAKENFGTRDSHESGEIGNHWYVRVNDRDVEISEAQYEKILDDILRERSISEIKDNIIGMISANKQAEIIAKNKVLQERANIENEIRREYPYIEYSSNPGGYIEAFIEKNKELQMKNNKYGKGSVNEEIYDLQEQLAKDVADKNFGAWMRNDSDEGREYYYVRVNDRDVEISKDQYNQILGDILGKRSMSEISHDIIGMISANKQAEIIAKNKVLQERANIENEIRKKYPYIEYSSNPGGYIEAFIGLNKELQMQNNKYDQGLVNKKIYALQEQLAENVAGRFYGVSVSYNDREGRYEYHPNEQFYNNAIARVKSGGIFKDIEQMQRQRNGYPVQRQGYGNQPGNVYQQGQNIQMPLPVQNNGNKMSQSQSLTDKIKEADKRVDVAKRDVQPLRSNNNNKSNKQRENNKAKGNLTKD